MIYADVAGSDLFGDEIRFFTRLCVFCVLVGIVAITMEAMAWRKPRRMR